MARVSIVHPDVLNLIREKLVPLFYHCGSVNALANTLNLAFPSSGKKIYPNQLHRLLSGDSDQYMNDATVEQISSAAYVVDMPVDDTKREELLAKVNLAVKGYLDKQYSIEKVVKEFRLPFAIVIDLLSSKGESKVLSETHESLIEKGGRNVSPDWSFQDIACTRCLQDLALDPNEKVGLVIPTGGGKTRVALRIALLWLSQKPSDQTIVWLTHQTNLRTQAQNELKSMINDGILDIPADSAMLLSKRVEFLMLSQISERISTNKPPIALLIVDEAHHAAAPSYSPIFDTPFSLNALFLTATPNRTDDLPIGIDRVSYSITYTELEERGVILRPKFEDFPVDNFDWSGEAVSDLANYIIERSESDFTKTLVIAPRVSRVEEFYNALLSALDNRVGHILSSEDIGFIHGQRNSIGCSNEEFLSSFSQNPRAIIVSARLLLEGFNDPSINSVIVTNPSKSLIQVIQSCGRCVRFSPGKTSAYFIQARQDRLAYHFDHRWLYQEISDYLRPALEDIEYSTVDELKQKITYMLQFHNCSDEASKKVFKDLEGFIPGSTCRLLFSGLPYYESKDKFQSMSAWTPILELPENSLTFRWIFNDFCERGADISDPSDLIRLYGKKFGFGGTDEENGCAKSYSNMLISMCMAAREIYQDNKYIGRPFHRYGSTTWLKYVTFSFVPKIPQKMQNFLIGCYNKDKIAEDYLEGSERYELLIKQPLPFGEWEAYLLTADTSNRFEKLIREVRASLAQTDLSEQFSVLASIIAKCHGIEGLPFHLLQRIDGFITKEKGKERTLDLDVLT
ncbi:DEAD/DEAH box helicase [Vibrio coralliirubri]|uniref:DEAD/DEAH box helicase n=1 Tax=Vibrio coralliirubri TaxID=1516159 RepID=UPI00069BE482|nr:DEAD/DEAH box helicase family protein [Vibrio coralliirubri]